ncbi:hypothetical protein WS90_35570 [Burkholderia cepacia]|uniref:HTH araC/xylS-type domain-containing protein n=1 Tax=Burkholderia cepacia TaxID=292 RepID=A0A103Z1Z2_BURCE|nr:helix-turn-helix transcriptional regulator [Burkholderia cepacia]KVK71886.1 hypothetical protein WS90_35570 [Burkholderia cepacia]
MAAAPSDNASSDFMPADLRQSVVTQTLPHSQVSISRLKTSRRDIGRTAPYELEDADLVVLQLRAFGVQELWLDGRVARFVPYQAGTVTIHDLDRRWVSDLKGTFDSIHFHLPRRTLEETVDEIGGRQRPQLYLPPLSIADVAKACGLSRGYLVKAFHQTTGLPPHRWLINQRIERAIMYMRTSSMPLHMISDACGFADQSHFTRTFTRVTGVTPRRWRADNL